MDLAECEELINLEKIRSRSQARKSDGRKRDIIAGKSKRDRWPGFSFVRPREQEPVRINKQCLTHHNDEFTTVAARIIIRTMSQSHFGIAG